MNETRTDQTPGTAPRQLRRSTRDRVLAGVAGGLGAYSNSDPLIWRILFVLTAPAGIGVLAYVAGWLLLPEDTDPAPTTAQRSDPRTWIGIGLVVFAGLIVLDRAGDWFGGFFWPALLIVAGVLLWQSGQRERTSTTGTPLPPPPSTPGATTPPAPSAPMTPAAPTSPSATSPSAGAGSPTTSPTSETAMSDTSTQQLPPAPPSGGWSPPPQPPHGASAWTPPPAPPRPRSPLGRIVFALILVMAGAAAILDNTGVIDVTVSGVLATALVMIGVGLVVGAWWGRARGLIALGLLLLPFIAVSSLANLADAPLAGAGDRIYRPTTAVELRDEYRLGAGKLVLDLSDLDLDGQRLDVAASVTFGELRVLLPDDLRVVVDGSVGIGELDALGVRQDGVGVEHTIVGRGAEGNGVLELDLDAGFGQITVDRSHTADPFAGATFRLDGPIVEVH